MGQKVHPTGFRVGITEPWRSRWYAPKRAFGQLLVEDEKIRTHIKREYGFAAIARIDIERTREEVNVVVHAGRPGLLIGRKGAEVDKIREELETLTGRHMRLEIREVAKPELSAQLVAENVAQQLEKRAAFRRAMKQAVDATMQAGAKGIKVRCAGRLGGAEMHRSEVVIRGSIPLQKLTANIDYGYAVARCPYGVLGVKVWIYLGEYQKQAEDTARGNDA